MEKVWRFQTFVVLTTIFMICGRIESYRWQDITEDDKTPTNVDVKLPSAKLVPESLDDLDGYDDETRKILQDAFRTSDDAKSNSEKEFAPTLRWGREHFGRWSYQPDVESIVFPEDRRRESTRRLIEAPSCPRTTVCEDAPHYPAELIDRALRSNRHLKELQTKDKPPLPGARQRISVGEEAVCTSRKIIIKPRIALSENNEWLYVANKNNFVQAITVQMCEREEMPCELVDGFSEGYQTSCKQEYMYRELMAVSTDGSIIRETFQIPSGCSCYISFTGNPLFRMNLKSKRKNSRKTDSQKSSN